MQLTRWIGVLLNGVVQPLLNTADCITYGKWRGARPAGDKIMETAPERIIGFGVETILKGGEVADGIDARQGRCQQGNCAGLHVAGAPRRLRDNRQIQGGRASRHDVAVACR